MLGWAGGRVRRVRCSPKGPKLGFEYLPAYKTLHCVHGIPFDSIPRSTTHPVQEERSLCYARGTCPSEHFSNTC